MAENRWMNPDAWRACSTPVDADGLRGRICFGGLDLSSTQDITAFVLVFPPSSGGEPYQVIGRFWIPDDNMRRRSRDDNVPYEAWVRQGWLKTTPGNVVDLDFIKAEIAELAAEFDIREVAFDRWGSAKIVQDLQKDGLTVIEMGQGYASISAPMKRLETLVLSKRIAHGGNIPLAWMIDNTVATEDPAGNIKADKQRSSERIDGVVAMIMALARADLYDESTSASMYDNAEIATV
jgi:phage terminase large subunit-like protein